MSARAELKVGAQQTSSCCTGTKAAEITPSNQSPLRRGSRGSPGTALARSHPPPRRRLPPSPSFAPWTTWQSPKLNISSGLGAAAVAGTPPLDRSNLVPGARPPPPRGSPLDLRRCLALLQLPAANRHFCASSPSPHPETRCLPGGTSPPNPLPCLCTLRLPWHRSSFLSREPRPAPKDLVPCPDAAARGHLRRGGASITNPVLCKSDGGKSRRRLWSAAGAESVPPAPSRPCDGADEGHSILLCSQGRDTELRGSR